MDTRTVAALLLAIALLYVPTIWRAFLKNRRLRSIPTVGPSGTLTSYIGAFRFFRNGKKMLQEGYDKFYGRLFKIPLFTSWVIVVSGDHLIDQIRRAPDDVFSLSEALREGVFLDVLVGPELRDDPFHADIVGGSLTKNIGPKFAVILDEIAAAFGDYMPLKNEEWTETTVYTTVMDIVCRTSNRMLVDLPLCRNPDWMELNKRFTLDVINAAIVLNLIPVVLRPIVIPLLRSIPRGVQRGIKDLEPLITERLEQDAQYGKDSSERPNDAISWILDAKKDKRSIPEIVHAVLAMNLASIHSSSMSFTYIIYELATRPEYVQPLRDEIEAVIATEGWSKDSVSKLWKVDSFVKECLRMADISMIAMGRKVLKDFTLSDGTTIPAGSTIGVPSSAVHADEKNYPNPQNFDGFRFEKLREQDSESTRQQFVYLNPEYLVFGHGRHACPGRFFVANVIKLMLAHVLLNYDIKMADGRGRPANQQFGLHSAPDKTAKILFRKRMKGDD